MAYDPVKAHEYYVQYRKKGLKKGRQKGKGKTVGLGSLSTSGLTDAGKFEVTLIKERLKEEMNEALAEAETDEEKLEIRRQYQQKAIAEIQALKANPEFGIPSTIKGVTPKKSKTSSGSSSKSSGSGRSKSTVSWIGSSGKSKSTSKSTAATGGTGGSSVDANAVAEAQALAQKQAKAKAQKLEKIKSSIRNLSASINTINARIPNMTAAERSSMKLVVDALMDSLKKLKSVRDKGL